MILGFFWPEIEDKKEAESVAYRSIAAAGIIILFHALGILTLFLNNTGYIFSDIGQEPIWRYIIIHLGYISGLGCAAGFVMHSKSLLGASAILILSLYAALGGPYLLTLPAVIFTIAGVRGAIQYHKLED